MRILHVSPTYFPAERYGGPIRSVHGLARGQARAGHQVDVFTTDLDGAARLDVPLEARCDLDGVGVYYHACQFVPICWSRGLERRLALTIADYDVVHVHSVFLRPGVVAGRLARRHGRPYLISPRGILVPELIARRRALLKHAWIGLYERGNFRRSSGVHVTSATEATDLHRCRMPCPRLLQIPNGVDLADPRARAETSDVLYLGRISWKKNLEALIAAISGLPKVGLTLAGPDDEGLWSRLQRVASETGCSDRVRWIGPVEDAAKADLFARHRVLALCSINENFGNVVAEAMAHACPVVVTPGVGARGVVEACGAGAVATDAGPEAIRATLVPFLASASEAHLVGLRGYEYARANLSWEAISARMLDGYRSVGAGDSGSVVH